MSRNHGPSQARSLSRPQLEEILNEHGVPHKRGLPILPNLNSSRFDDDSLLGARIIGDVEGEWAIEQMKGLSKRIWEVLGQTGGGMRSLFHEPERKPGSIARALSNAGESLEPTYTEVRSSTSPSRARAFPTWATFTPKKVKNPLFGAAHWRPEQGGKGRVLVGQINWNPFPGDPLPIAQPGVTVDLDKGETNWHREGGLGGKLTVFNAKEGIEWALHGFGSVRYDKIMITKVDPNHFDGAVWRVSTHSMSDLDPRHFEAERATLNTNASAFVGNRVREIGGPDFLASDSPDDASFWLSHSGDGKSLREFLDSSLGLS